MIDVLIPSYKDLDLLKVCVGHLSRSSIADTITIYILNNDSSLTEKSFSSIKRMMAYVEIVDIGFNSGFGFALNKGIEQSSSEFVFVCNSDLFVEPLYLEKMVVVLRDHKDVGQVTGKLLRYDLKKDKKTDIIDSTGLVIRRNRRVIDRGAGQKDNSQFEDGVVFGASGAASFIRRKALEDIMIDGEYYDSNFFMYKEDIDLSWRMMLAGWKSWYVGDAIAYHGRTSTGLENKKYLFNIPAFIMNERRKRDYVKVESMKNHWMMLIKNERCGDFIRDALWIFGRESMVFSHNLLFSPILTLKSIIRFMKQLPSTIRKRHQIQARSRMSSGVFRYMLSQ